MDDADQQLDARVDHRLNDEVLSVRAGAGDCFVHLLGRAGHFCAPSEADPNGAHLGLVKQTGPLRLQHHLSTELLGGLTSLLRAGG